MKIIFTFFILSITTFVCAQDASYTQEELIYGRKDGMALTLLHLKPKKNPVGKAIIRVISGNWISSYNRVGAYIEGSQLYIENGYSVFLVMHGSQPRYPIPNQVADIQRATRFIRFHARKFGIDPTLIGITGASSGGNLSLLVATSNDAPDLKSSDTIDRVSARVQAVAVFYPPTDFFNWGAANASISKNEQMLRYAGVAAAFDFKYWNDSTKLFASVTDTAKRLEIYRDTSPIYAVSSDDPPVFIIHGDKDRVVPLQQSESIISKFAAAKVPNKFVIIKDKGHGWNNQDEETKDFIKWFDTWLKKKN